MTVKLIRMWSGEDVIADIVEETKEFLKIENPIVAVPSPQQGQIAFAPWSPLAEKGGLKVLMQYVVYVTDPQSEIIEQHQQMYGKISTPTKKLII